MLIESSEDYQCRATHEARAMDNDALSCALPPGCVVKHRTTIIRKDLFYALDAVQAINAGAIDVWLSRGRQL
jgi:hypothetical protein